MPRGEKSPSEVFAGVMAVAKECILLEGQDAAAFEHRGIRGDERAAVLSDFLRRHLPNRFSVAKGEVIDYQDNRSTQLDIIVYDGQTSAPLRPGKGNSLIPAEALYAAVEVKTILQADDLVTCFRAARSLRALQPYKTRFVPPRQEGAAADKQPRCIYCVFAYATNLAEENWPRKEYGRILDAAKTEGVDLDCIDRVVVLSRGSILPATAVGKEERADSQSVFLDFYLHLVNFLTREAPRRTPVDWQIYGPETSPGWKKLD